MILTSLKQKYVNTVCRKSHRIVRATFPKLHAQMPQFSHLSHKDKGKSSRCRSEISDLNKLVNSNCFKQ